MSHPQKSVLKVRLQMSHPKESVPKGPSPNVAFPKIHPQKSVLKCRIPKNPSSTVAGTRTERTFRKMFERNFRKFSILFSEKVSKIECYWNDRRLGSRKKFCGTYVPSYCPENGTYRGFSMPGIDCAYF